MTSMIVMTADHLDKLKIADHAWQTAKQEADEAAEWRREVVKEAREAGHSLQEVADILGISIGSVSNLAKGSNLRSNR